MPVALCKDPVTRELNKRGYNLVKLPRVGIEPMDVLGRDGTSVEKLGSISEVWTSSGPLPSVGAPTAVAGIGGERTSDLDVGIGLKLLADALAGLGGGISLPSLSVAFKQARTVQFRFDNVESTSVTPFALGKYLASGTLDTSNVFVAPYFGNDETQEYIIFDVLKSDAISVTAKSERGTEVSADANALAGAVGANVTVKGSVTGSTEITFKGHAKVTFAFKVFEVVFEDGTWKPSGVAPGDGVEFALPGEDDEAGPAILLKPGQLVRLK
ncbi:MAG: hypothetical protein H0V80_18100 [Acidobacteria bacterium]|nr:hypothetical protein [Acidobacteriota bacterium]